MTNHDLSTSPTIDVLRSCLASAASEAALALGLVRVLTLLPLYDASLDEIEQHLAQNWESLLYLRRLLDTPELFDTDRPSA